MAGSFHTHSSASTPRRASASPTTAWSASGSGNALHVASAIRMVRKLACRDGGRNREGAIRGLAGRWDAG